MDTAVEDARSSRFLLAALLILAIAAAFIITPFLTGVLFAIVVAYLLQRPYHWLARKLRSRAIAAAIMLVFTIAIVVAPFVGIAYAVADDAVEAVTTIEADGGFENMTIRLLTRLGMQQESAATVYDDAVGAIGERAQGAVLPTLARLGSAAANIGVFIFLLYFLLVEGKQLAAYVGRAMPLPPARRDHLVAQVGGRVRALFLGTFLVALVQGSVATLGWWLLGFPAPLFWGFVMTILSVIPAIGPVIIMIPAGLLSLAQGDVFQGGAIIVYALTVVTFSDNLVRPFIVGRSSGVHPALVLVGTLGGLLVFGTTGFILGPLILSMIEPVLTEWEAIRPGPG